jgi:CheY-like chemotaxis protein
VAPVEPRKARVLVVEDNTINQMVLVKMLRKLGYSHVTTACDGDEAVAHCEDLPVDIIFMDIQMRVMDGYTATERIRALPYVGERPWIIALTAGVQEEDTEKAYQAGMNAFATKPIVIEALAKVLEEAESALASSKHSLAH